MPTIAEGIYPVPAILVCLICPLLLVNASDWFSLKGEFSSLALCMQTPFFCLLVLEPKWSQLMCQMANTYLLKHYFVHQALNNAMLFYYSKAFYIYNVKGRKFLSGNCQHLCFGICSKMCNDCGCLYIIYSSRVRFFIEGTIQGPRRVHNELLYAIFYLDCMSVAIWLE